jgi:hypothetical protein
MWIDPDSRLKSVQLFQRKVTVFAELTGVKCTSSIFPAMFLQFHIFCFWYSCYQRGVHYFLEEVDGTGWWILINISNDFDDMTIRRIQNSLDIGNRSDKMMKWNNPSASSSQRFMEFLWNLWFCIALRWLHFIQTWMVSGPSLTVMPRLWLVHGWSLWATLWTIGHRRPKSTSITTCAPSSHSTTSLPTVTETPNWFSTTRIVPKTS